MVDTVPRTSFEAKLAILSAALSDAQENLRFAESKAGFTAVILTAAVTVLPAVPTIKDIIGFKAIRDSFTSLFVREVAGSAPLSIVFQLSGQFLLLSAFALIILGVLLSIRAAIPMVSARSHIDLDCDDENLRCYPNLFYPTGFNRSITYQELLGDLKKDLKFSFSAYEQRCVLQCISEDEICYTLGEQVLILGVIRDVKMRRVALAVRCVLYSAYCISACIIILALRFFAFG